MAGDLLGWRVLAVDDEPDNLRLISDVMEFMGAQVGHALGGQEGLDQVDTFKPTLILLDLAMPGIDGWEMHRRLRQRPELDGIPIMALTALAMAQDAERAMAAGFDGYIIKPFRLAELLDQLKSAVAGFHANHRNGGSTDG